MTITVSCPRAEWDGVPCSGTWTFRCSEHETVQTGCTCTHDIDGLLWLVLADVRTEYDRQRGAVGAATTGG